MQTAQKTDIKTSQPEAPLIGLSGKTETLSTDGTGAFSRLIDCLSEVRELQSKAIADLDSFANLAAADPGNSSDPLQCLLASIQAMHAALKDFCERHSDLDARNSQSEVERLLSDINRHSQTLSVVATLTKTTAASYGTSAFVEYVDDLSKIALVIREASEAVLSTLKNLAEREAASLASCTSAQDRLSQLLQVARQRAEQINALQQKERIAAEGITDTSRDLVSRTNQHMNVFVTAAQFSDRLAQRLDHLAAILNRKGCNLEALAAAQARSLSKDVTTVAQEVSDTMQALLQIWREGTAIYSGGTIADSIEQSLDTRRKTAQSIVSRFSEIRAALRSTFKDAEALPDMIAAAKDNFQRLEDNTRAVAYSAMNSSLLASRSNKARHAMSALSFEVRDTAHKCLAAVQASQRELQAVAHNSAFGIQELMDTGTSLEEAITLYEGEIENGQQRLTQLDALRSGAVSVTSKLLEQVEAAIQCMRDVERISDELSDMASLLDQTANTTAPPHEVLLEVWNSYSMDDERHVHEALYPGLAQVPGETADTSDGDDLDDVFF
jgi:hypothetical protein